jgi:hypothetical protein
MPSCEVLVSAEETTPTPLASAWVYVNDGGTTTTYRTGPDGRLCKLAPGAPAADATRPWKYQTKALLEVPKTVRIYTSKGARPIPKSVLDASVFNDAQTYSDRTIALPADAPASPIASTTPTTLALAVAEVAVPGVDVQLTQPRELSLCPVLWDDAPKDDADPNKDFLRAGIGQGADTPAEGSAPGQPPAAAVVHERGVSFKGTVGSAVQQARIRFLDANGSVVGVRTSATGARAEQIVVATTPGGAGRSFDATVWFDDPAHAFGLVHVIVESHDAGEECHHLEAFTVLLAGLQLAMVDDSTSNLDGASAGAVGTEAQETVVLDFKRSPVREVASSNLFLHAYRVKRNQADKAVSDKAKHLDTAKTGFAGLQKPASDASTALATAVSQTSAAQAKAKLEVARTKLTALRTAVNQATLSAKITAALSNDPTRDATGDGVFDAAMQSLATALTAVNAVLSPALTQSVTALTAALTSAEQQVAGALTQVAIEVSTTVTAAATATAHAARVAATTSATAQLQALETARASGVTVSTTGYSTLVADSGPAKTALRQAETRKTALLADAKAKANAELEKERRARRMIRYAIRGDQQRAYGGTGPLVPHPQMPMFMAELHLLGLNKARLEELLERRKKSVPAVVGVAAPESIRLEIDWRLRFKWKGPDVDPPVSPPASFADPNAGGYRLDQEFRGLWTASKLQTVSQAVNIQLGSDDTIGLDGDAVKDAFEVAPVALPFPVATRRKPIVALANRERAWGRRAGAASGAAMVVEWQTPIVDAAGREILRGGDGVLTVSQLAVDGQRIDRGVSATVASATADLQFVPFRVSGDNVAANVNDASDPLAQSIEAVVGEAHTALAATHVARSINVAGWKLAYRRIVNHESGARQFNNATWLDFRNWEGNMVWSYGQEKGMPLHGHPHGYTMGQCDPHPRDDAMWSYLEAIRAGVGVLFQKAVQAKVDLEARATQATQAYQDKVTAGTVTPQDQNPNASIDLTIAKHREALLRQATKRYNGGQEFVWGHPHGYAPPALPAVPAPMSWVISPSIKNDYPNRALGTSVNYNQAEPIDFTQFVLPP